MERRFILEIMKRFYILERERILRMIIREAVMIRETMIIREEMTTLGKMIIQEVTKTMIAPTNIGKKMMVSGIYQTE